MLNPGEQNVQSASVANVMGLPRTSRDGFVAETAIKLDRLETTVTRLERESEHAKKVVADLLDHAEQSKRLNAFEETLRNSREYKIDEMLRCCRSLKERIDRIEGNKGKFPGLPYNSFESMNEKLSELTALQAQIEMSEKRVRLVSMLFYAVSVLLVVAIGWRFLPI